MPSAGRSLGFCRVARRILESLLDAPAGEKRTERSSVPGTSLLRDEFLHLASKRTSAFLRAFQLPLLCSRLGEARLSTRISRIVRRFWSSVTVSEEFESWQQWETWIKLSLKFVCRRCSREFVRILFESYFRLGVDVCNSLIIWEVSIRSRRRN